MKDYLTLLREYPTADKRVAYYLGQIRREYFPCLTVNDIVRICDVTDQTIRNFENGKCVNPTLMLFYLRFTCMLDPKRLDIALWMKPTRERDEEKYAKFLEDYDELRDTFVKLTDTLFL